MGLVPSVMRKWRGRFPGTPRIRFTSPERSSLLVLDGELGEQYSSVLLAEFEYSRVNPRPGTHGSVLYLSAALVVGIVRRLAAGGFEAAWNWRRRLVYSYFAAIVRHVAPRAIVSMRGGFTPWFGRLANEFPDIEFIAVAAAQVHTAHMANVVPSRAHYYVYGEFDRERLVAAGQNASLVHPVGALLGGYVHARGWTRAEMCYDICIPSQVVDLALVSDDRALLNDRPTLLKIQRLLAEYVSRYAREHDLRVAVALRPQELGAAGAAAERHFFEECLKCRHELIESSPEQFSTYHAIARSRIVVTHCSTTGFEVMPWPKRVLFCEFVPYGPYRLPGELQWRVVGESYEVFRDRMDELLNTPEAVFAADAAASIRYFNGYSSTSPPHAMVADHLRAALAPAATLHGKPSAE